MLTMTKDDYEKILAHCKEGLPNEACGLIGGTKDGGEKHIKKVYLLTNIDESNEHFSMDPKEQLAAVKDMRANGYQLLGNYYKMGDETIEGLGVVNIHTERGDSRLISNIVLQSDLFPLPIVGFENHGGRTFIEDYQPLGKVLSGHGNNDKDKSEGIVYKNVIGTYLHGPLLPKNTHLCDYLLQTALNRRFGKVELPELDDKDELAANHYIVKRFAPSE